MFIQFGKWFAIYLGAWLGGTFNIHPNMPNIKYRSTYKSDMLSEDISQMKMMKELMMTMKKKMMINA